MFKLKLNHGNISRIKLFKRFKNTQYSIWGDQKTRLDSLWDGSNKYYDTLGNIKVLKLEPALN